MINSLQLFTEYRDWVGEWAPPAIAQLSPINTNRCFATRYYLTPSFDKQVCPANGYIETSVSVRPGSLVWGIFYRPIPDVSLGFSFNLRSVALDLPLFSEPVPSEFITGGDNLSRPGGVILPCPYPSVGNGLFKVQFWNRSETQEQRIAVVLAAAEVVECQR